MEFIYFLIIYPCYATVQNKYQVTYGNPQILSHYKENRELQPLLCKHGTSHLHLGHIEVKTEFIVTFQGMF